jgi:hypothetical protein
MGPAYLAGAFAPARCDLRLYSELSSGPLEDERLLAWPDMLVLTGLTTALDRMRHLTAYARTKNPGVVVVAGGHAVRALPRYCGRFFDYCCLGDVEELREVVADAFGQAYVAEEMLPRFDLAGWLGHIGYLETSRYCNFHCSFCTLTAEGRRYEAYELDFVHRQILSLGRRRFLVFIDNNFFGSDRQRFLARLDLLREFRRRGQFQGWSALVTNDFFLTTTTWRHGGRAWPSFQRVESFDVDWLEGATSRRTPAAPTWRYPRHWRPESSSSTGWCSTTRRRLAETGSLTSPWMPGDHVAACFDVDPILRTPFFHDCVRGDGLLPNTRVRDLDGTTLSVRPLDPVEEVGVFVRDLQTLRGYRARVLRHMARFACRYRTSLTPYYLGVALSNAALLCAPVGVSGPTRWRGRRLQRTYVSTTDVLDPVYTPAFRVDGRYADYFRPTAVTDSAGRVTDELADDLLCA